MRESKPPPPSLSDPPGAAQIPRPKFDIKDPWWKEILVRSKLNSCRPLSVNTIVKIKDYAHSLHNFTAKSTKQAKKIIFDMLGTDQRGRLNNSPKDLSEFVPPKMTTDKSTPEIDAAYNKAQQVMKGDTGTKLPPAAVQGQLSTIIGNELDAKVQAVDLKAVNFSMTYGLENEAIAELVRSLTQDGFNANVLIELLPAQKRKQLLQTKQPVLIGSKVSCGTGSMQLLESWTKHKAFKT
eukprot:Plantae.Rhodophyta-Purpureofilum_apyrenoidigerum.ctg38898.p1 GENE.Plantae.Rhodophyta-Purpureofilum_apyrenoidigerum.ctg38898~~Plantae.Rhodophyta-Purpureofilum_apyrenoidigerum.ctg38898.p1  ORF type:complete len:238 (+),score=37.35 Plantae.Rhodophyta-Purpureofilum_apyrenoidigerum.ctg38898:542-1255(+)